jgi:hypothetical protein
MENPMDTPADLIRMAADAAWNDGGVNTDEKRILNELADALSGLSLEEIRRLAGNQKPKVFVKALIAPGKHVAQIVNESPGSLELWLETADGMRHIRHLDAGASIYL